MTDQGYNCNEVGNKSSNQRKKEPFMHLNLGLLSPNTYSPMRKQVLSLKSKKAL